MKQKFTKKSHDKFIQYFNIKKEPSKIENKFYKKTERYIKYIKWIPGLKMIGIGNSISMNCANNKSDIDLFIVTSPNSMWLNRILITLIFQILLVRKTPTKHAGRFCLSFFATTNGLDFSEWKIENDIYLYFWILYFKPILNNNSTYELFIEKNKSWADFDEYKRMINDNKKYIKYKKPHPCPEDTSLTGIISFSPSREKEATFSTPPLLQRRGGWGVRFLNKTLKNIFLPKTLKHYNSLGKPYGVIINDNLLKFHNGDIREKIKKELV